MDAVSPEETIRFWTALRRHLWEKMLPLIAGLEETANDLCSTPFEEGAADLVRRLQAGMSLSEAMEVRKDLFPESTVAAVRAGEARGLLDEVSKRILDSFRDGTVLPPGALGDPADEPVRFWRAFGFLLGSGIPLLTVLDILAAEIAHGDLRQSARVMARAISEGDTLTDAMKVHPELFDEEVVGIVAQAEEKGTLDYAVLEIARGLGGAPDKTPVAGPEGASDGLLNLLGDGLSRRASDVRMEFFRRDGKLGFRIEGTLDA
jgi:type II secretory pathway component PulF